jgi:molybdenum cofactor guanylyltransferase
MNSTVPYDAGAIVLAGGKSRRMGKNKCLLPYQGLPLIQHVTDQLRPLFQDVLISTNEPDLYGFLGLPMVADEVTDQGPLMGIASALAQSQHDWNLVVATDIPDIPLPLIVQMYEKTIGHTCVVPITHSGKYEPLFAFYHRSLVAPIRTCLESGKLRVQDILEISVRCDVSIEDTLLSNLNTQTQYSKSNR